MRGYLVDGVFVAATSIAAIEFLKWTPGNPGLWVLCKSIEEWNATGEATRAIKIVLDSGVTEFIPGPTVVKVVDGTTLLNWRP